MEAGRPGIAQVKNTIAIGSGKGGVGKSTVSANLAMALKELGYRVGLLDADIYGPTQPILMGGSGQNPRMGHGGLLPVECHGIKVMSMGMVQNPQEAVVIRSPLAIKALQQLLNSVLWGELDYLLIDLPPGTGDIQLTLAQQAHLTGAVVVTTPQKVSGDIARKGAHMFQSVHVPILGILENMSGFLCPHCEKPTAVFGSGAGEALAQSMQVPFLGKIPLDPQIMQAGDEGKPVSLSNLASAQYYLQAAKTLVENGIKINQQNKQWEFEKIEFSKDRQNIVIHWRDSQVQEFSVFQLRLNCSCARCVNEHTGQRMIAPAQIKEDIKAMGATPVGRYGLSILFSDGHNTGIYKLDKLKSGTVFAAGPA